jgi:hypothetical protein
MNGALEKTEHRRQNELSRSSVSHYAELKDVRLELGITRGKTVET